MSNLIKEKILEHKKVGKVLAIIISLPFSLSILNLLLDTIFQLGIHMGTFLRFLYQIVVY